MSKNTSVLRHVAPALVHIGLALVCVLLWSSMAHAAQVVTLKTDSVIKEQYVRVGHIFEGAGNYSSHPLAPAPEPGDKLVLNTKDLNRIVEAFDFQWAPMPERHQITLSSNATRIGSEQISYALQRSDLVNMVGHAFEISYDKGSAELIVNELIVPSVGIENIDYDPISERFSATIYAPATGKRLASKQVTGEAARIINLPLLSNRLKAGDVITKHDLMYVPKRAKDLKNNIIINPEDIIGMTPRRVIMPMSPITETDLTHPKMVKRNEQVTIELSRGALRLSAKGRALGDGAKGDTVDVMNLQSKRVIEAVVTGHGSVTIENIRGPAIMAMN